MKARNTNQSVVVPIRKTDARQQSDLYPMAMELGNQRTLLEKLLYRVQQVERREKAMRNTISALRREITTLKGGQTRRREARVSSGSQETGSSRFSERNPPEVRSYDDGAPDFSSAMSELDSSSH